MNRLSSVTAGILALIGLGCLLVLGPAAGLTGISPSIGLWEQTAKITPSDSDEPGWYGLPSHTNVRFGASVAVDGDLLAAGTGSSINSVRDWIYVFEHNDEEWEEVAKLIPPGQTNDSNFGVSVDLDEDEGLLIAGDEGEPETGSAYLYHRTHSGNWELLDQVVGPEDNPDGWTEFGVNVAIDGTTVAVSDARSAHAGIISGAVYLYEVRDGSLEMTQVITSLDPESNSGFGYSLAMDDDRLLVGATAQGEHNEGRAYVYQREDDQWTLQSELGAPDPETDETLGGGRCFGFSVDIHDDVLVVGDTCWRTEVDHATGMYATGKGYVFHEDGGTWELAAELQPVEKAPRLKLGYAVGADDDTVVLGATTAPGGVGPVQPRMGAAYVYEFEETLDTWVQTSRLIGNDTVTSNYFGETLDTNDGRIAVGAVNNDNPQDGRPPPLSYFGHFPPRVFGVRACIDSPPSPWACTDGARSGSVYVFEKILSSVP